VINLNKQIALSAVSIFAAMSLMGGAAFAFFSDSATSTGNVFASGTLDLLLDDNDEVTPAATVTASFGGNGLVPGATSSGFLSLHNNGTVNIAEVKLSGTETETSSPDLATVLNITSAKIGTESTCTTAPVDITGSFSTLAALNTAGFDLPSSAITAGSTKYLCMTFTMDATANNTFQGKTITETFTLEGHQDLTQ
jgi:predicted ribosomally synthesized peptide with SipW-like signal peptide